MNSDNKTPLELNIEIVFTNNNIDSIRMHKILYASFVPQHGMDILDTEIFFRVRTTAMAGLQTLKHTASPIRKGRYIEGSRKITSKLFVKNESQCKESIDFFIKQGWVLDT